MPGYLKKGWVESRCQRVAKFRFRNGVRESYYWREKVELKCRVCGFVRKTWEHVWEGLWEEGGSGHGKIWWVGGEGGGGCLNEESGED